MSTWSHNLPAQPTALLGRAEELASVRALLLRDDVRLVTLTGAAGTGKTRLAIAVATELADTFSDGVWFVDLSTIADPGLVAPTIASTLGLRDTGDRALVQTLRMHLDKRRVLLVLDNFEQVVYAAGLVADLLSGAAGFKVLATSRVALRLRWEHELEVAPLALPDLARLSGTEDLGRVASVRLFVDRARASRSDFGLTAANAKTVAEICVRLDGLPLAIELAGARCKFVPVEVLLGRLEHRLDELIGGARDQPARQQTLRAAIAWSYDLLSPEEKTLFRRLGVFVGGFAPEAVGEVCDPDGALGDLGRRIESQVDATLIRRASSSEARFTMLETVREFALERLGECGEVDVTRKRHAGYFLSEADVANAQMRTDAQGIWLARLEAEHDNIRAALRWCEEVGDAALGVGALGLLSWFWSVRGYLSEGRRRVGGLLRLEAPPALRARALSAAGRLAFYQGDFEGARLHQEECLLLQRGLDDPVGLGAALSGLGHTAMQQGDYTSARALLEEGLATQRGAREQPPQQSVDPAQLAVDLWGTLESLNGLADLAQREGDLDGAHALYEQCRAICAAVGFREDGFTLNLALVALARGDLAGARSLFELTAATARHIGDGRQEAHALANLASVAAAEGDRVEARALLARGLTIEQRIGEPAGLALLLERLAELDAADGQHERALILAGAANALRGSAGVPLPDRAQSKLDARLDHARRLVGESGAAVARAHGERLSLAEVVELALRTDPRAESKKTGPLSPREEDVAALIARGLTNRQIATELVIAERTVDGHVASILNKLGLSRRTQVATWHQAQVPARS